MSENILTGIKLNGLSCSACQKIIEKRLGKINGVHQVNVVLESGKVDIQADRTIDRDEIIKALEGTEYKIL